MHRLSLDDHIRSLYDYFSPNVNQVVSNTGSPNFSVDFQVPDASGMMHFSTPHRQMRITVAFPANVAYGPPTIYIPNEEHMYILNGILSNSAHKGLEHWTIQNASIGAILNEVKALFVKNPPVHIQTTANLPLHTTFNSPQVYTPQQSPITTSNASPSTNTPKYTDAIAQQLSTLYVSAYQQPPHAQRLADIA